MRVTLQIPDDVYEAYATRAKARNRRTDRLLADELKAIFPHDLARERVIIIDPENRQRVESLLGEGHITDATDLANRFERLLSIMVGGVRLDFTPSQLHDLSELAARNGYTMEQMVKATVRSMEELFFDHVAIAATVHAEELRTA